MKRKRDRRPPPSAKPASDLGRRALLVLGVIVLAATLIRLPGLCAGLWHDEIMYSRVYFDRPVERAWLFWHDVHPPVYPVLIWLWSSVLGNHEAVLRLPSLLAGLGSLLVVWKLSRRWLGLPAASLATALLAFSPPHIWYSVEDKANMLAVFLSVLALWLFVRVADRTATVWQEIAAYGALMLALGTHSYAVATAGTLCTWLGWRAWRERHLRRPAILTVILLFAGWLPLFLWKTLAQGNALARPYLRPLDLDELYKFLFIWLPHGNTLRTISPYARFGRLFDQPWSYFLVDAIGAAGLALGLVAAVRAARSRPAAPSPPHDPWPSRLLLLWFVPPLAAGLLASLAIRHFYIERNFLLLLPAFSILLALGIENLRWPKMRMAAGAGLLAMALVSTFFLLVVRKDRWTVYKPKPDWRAAAAWIERQAANRGESALVTTTPSLEVDFYLGQREASRAHLSFTDFCQIRPSLFTLAQRAGGTVFLVKNETWIGCWNDAWRQVTATPSLVVRNEQHFNGLVIHELGTK
jgi:hypothetical protein